MEERESEKEGEVMSYRLECSCGCGVLWKRARVWWLGVEYGGVVGVKGIACEV